MSLDPAEWRTTRAQSYFGEAVKTADTAPLSSRTAAYYAGFHACHVALLTDSRFDEPDQLAAIDPQLRQYHREPVKHTGGPDRVGNVGLAWVLAKMRPELNGFHDYLRQVSNEVRYGALHEHDLLASPEACIQRARLTLKRVGLLGER